MKITLESPTKLRFENVTPDEFIHLQAVLRYRDKTVEETIRRTKKNPYHHQRLGQEEFQKLLDSLQAQLYKSLLYEDEYGPYTLPGLKDLIIASFKEVTFQNDVFYPNFELLPWAKPLDLTPKDYQAGALQALLANPHSHVEIATGLGKTLISILLIKQTGLPTIISTPSAGLARSLYRELTELFGKRKVGLFGDGKKEIGKDILVCVGKSLSMVEGDDIDQFKKYKVFISDESHTLPAAQFNYFCHTVVGHCPYRWFMSATQERNDGKDMLLDGIIGPMVYEKTIQQGIADGDLAKISTLIFDVPSYSAYQNSGNTVKMNQSHFYKNIYIADIVATLVRDAMAQGIPTLILIDEHDQELTLRNKVGLIYEYAKGGSDTAKICRDFNAGKFMCVVGTSAISTGTNFKPNRLTINWQAGKAETKFKQGVIGRSTRTDEATGKTECKIVDFRVKNIPMMLRHGNARIRLYREIGPVQIVEYKA